jgi:hypothetical protein
VEGGTGGVLGESPTNSLMIGPPFLDFGLLQRAEMPEFHIYGVISPVATQWAHSGVKFARAISS